MGILAGVLSMFFWGTAIFLAAIAARKIGNVLTLFWMQLFGFITGGIYFLVSLSEYDFSQFKDHVFVLVVIAALQVVAYLGFYSGLEKAKVSLVSPIGAAWGLVTAILGVIFFGETLSLLQILAVGIIVVGIIIISLNISDLFKQKQVNLLVGVKEGVIAMLGWGISLFLLVIPSKDLGWFLPAFSFRLFVLLMLAGFILLTSKAFTPKTKKLPLKLLIIIGVFDMAGFLSYSFGVAGEFAAIVAPIGSAFAVVTILLAKIFLKEKITNNQVLGIASVIAGLVIISL